jgi:hypothetical protein
MPIKMAAGKRIESLPYALSLSESVGLVARGGVTLVIFATGARFCVMAPGDTVTGSPTTASDTDKSAGSNFD